MIVSCPDCGTLYRCAAAFTASRTRCSSCGRWVPVPARQQYAVHPIAYAEAVAGRWTGLQGSLRAGLRPTATVDFPGGGANAAIARGRAGVGLSRAFPEIEQPGAASAGAPTRSGIAEGAAGPVVHAASGPFAPGAAAESAEDGGSPGIARRAVARTLVYVVSGMAAGALAGFAGASWFGGSAMVWSAGGALVGTGSALGMRGSWTSRND